MTFDSLGLKPQILSALKQQGYTQPTPIQAQSIPVLLEGYDLLGTAQTGTGKTAAFTIPIIEHLLNAPSERKRRIKALVVTPTRELALQVAENAKRYSSGTSLRTAVIFGGVGANPQIDQLKRGIDILVATPGRLLDLQSQGFIDLRSLTHFVLDEADQMLDMGFIHDIKKLLRLIPSKRQSLFFSATMPKTIMELSGQILKPNYKQVRIAVEKPTAERVSQCVYFVRKTEKPSLLIHLLNEIEGSVLVFGRTKHGCDKVVRILDKKGIRAAAIHGNKSQNARQKALKGFKEGTVRVLVATDIAARGIDISGLEHVINYELPNISETYVHRIGRTGRADASGSSISFCSADERGYLKDIEKLIKAAVPLVEEHPFTEGAAEEWSVPENRIPAKQGQRSQRTSRDPKKGGGNPRSGASGRGKRPSRRH
ncbi:MAG: DEAD/DEAH box helicase [Schleiferiaceae bacterium]|nr:DEAD/DEAH box helicase [Schleiferiaceae bacterium]